MKFALNKDRKEGPSRITSIGVGEGRAHKEFKVGKDGILDVPDQYYRYTTTIEQHGFTRIDSGAKDFEEPSGEKTKTKAQQETPRTDGNDENEDEA